MLNSRQISQKSAFQNRVAERKNSSKLEQQSPRINKKPETSWEDFFIENPVNHEINDDQKISLLLFKTSLSEVKMKKLQFKLDNWFQLLPG